MKEKLGAAWSNGLRSIIFGNCWRYCFYRGWPIYV